MRRLARRGLTQARHQTIAKQDLFDLLRIEPGTLNSGANRGTAQVDCAGRREFTQKTTNRGPGRGENHNRVIHGGAP